MVSFSHAFELTIRQLQRKHFVYFEICTYQTTLNVSKSKRNLLKLNKSDER